MSKMTAELRHEEPFRVDQVLIKMTGYEIVAFVDISPLRVPTSFLFSLALTRGRQNYEWGGWQGGGGADSPKSVCAGGARPPVTRLVIGIQGR